MSTKAKVLISVASLLVVAMMGLVIFYFAFFRIVRSPTGSMANTIIPGESVLCDLRGGEVKRGDIVLFKRPEDQKEMYLSRVIGLPGERIRARGTRVYVNDQELPEARTFINQGDGKGALEEISSEGGGPYRVYYEKRDDRDDELYLHSILKYGVIEEYRIPQGHYYVLGDCRDNSFDSRYWGTVPRELIIGKALMIVNSTAKDNAERLFKPLK